MQKGMPSPGGGFSGFIQVKVLTDRLFFFHSHCQAVITNNVNFLSAKRSLSYYSSLPNISHCISSPLIESNLPPSRHTVTIDSLTMAFSDSLFSLLSLQVRVRVVHIFIVFPYNRRLS